MKLEKIFRKFKEPNYIDNNLELNGREEISFINNSKFLNIAFFGEIFGRVHNKGAISREQVLDEISKVTNLDDLIEIIKFIVGAVWFYIKKEDVIYLISSQSVAPLYFYKIENKLLFSIYEAEIYAYAKQNEQINPFEIFDILNTHRFDTVPYGAMFNNVIRIPGGHTIIIDKKLNLLYKSNLLTITNNKIKPNYLNFKNFLEGTAKLYVESGKKIHVLFSAGIDSSAVLYALKKYSDSVIPVATTIAYEGGGLADPIREKLLLYEDFFGIDSIVLIADRFSKNQTEMKNDLCKLNSNNNARWDSYVFFTVMEKFQNENNCLFLTGQEMDDGYGIAFTKYHRDKAIRHTFMLGRYFYSRFYQKHLKFFFHEKLRKMHRGKKNIKDLKEEYLTSMVYMREYQSRYLPLIYNLSSYPKDFIEKYKNYKEKMFLRCAFKNPDEIKTLSKSLINNKIRILRHYFSVPNMIKDTETMSKYSNPKFINLPVEGPMVNYFCNLRLGWRDILVGKRFIYKYFKERTGQKYLKIFTPPNILPYRKKANELIKGEKLRLKVVRPINFTFTEAYQEDFRNNVDLTQPILYKYLNNQYIEKFAKQLYYEAAVGVADYNDLQNIYNLEIFLKNLDIISENYL
ncbi:MAG: hypothetical protein ACFFAN_00415 [Promethearchaeota archaeon]